MSATSIGVRRKKGLTQSDSRMFKVTGYLLQVAGCNSKWNENYGGCLKHCYWCSPWGLQNGAASIIVKNQVPSTLSGPPLELEDEVYQAHFLEVSTIFVDQV